MKRFGKVCLMVAIAIGVGVTVVFAFNATDWSIEHTLTVGTTSQLNGAVTVGPTSSTTAADLTMSNGNITFEHTSTGLLWAGIGGMLFGDDGFILFGNHTVGQGVANDSIGLGLDGVMSVQTEGAVMVQGVDRAWVDDKIVSLARSELHVSHTGGGAGSDPIAALDVMNPSGVIRGSVRIVGQASQDEPSDLRLYNTPESPNRAEISIDTTGKVLTEADGDVEVRAQDGSTGKIRADALISQGDGQNTDPVAALNVRDTNEGYQGSVRITGHAATEAPSTVQIYNKPGGTEIGIDEHGDVVITLGQ